MSITLDRTSPLPGTSELNLKGLPHASKEWSHRPPRRGETTPEVARESRFWRVGMRLFLPDAWQAHLHSLSHHDPSYAYDELYEYEDDWTTDPHYAGRVSQAWEYDQDGFAVSAGSRHQDLITFLRWVLSTFLGSRVVREPELHIPVAISETLELYTESGRLRSMYKPDLLVLPNPLETERERARSEYEVRMDRGHPAPVLAVEVLSDTSEQRDFVEKHAVYEALGIQEYLVVNPGEPPDPDDPEDTGTEPDIFLFRLDRDGVYQMVEDEDPLHVCDVGIRLVENDDVDAHFPVMLQWWDPDADAWREPVSDGHEKGRDEGEAIAVLNLIPALLGSVLSAEDLQALSDHWGEHGVPSDYRARVQEVQAHPERWLDICGISYETDGDDTPEPGSEGPR